MKTCSDPPFETYKEGITNFFKLDRTMLKVNRLNFYKLFKNFIFIEKNMQELNPLYRKIK